MKQNLYALLGLLGGSFSLLADPNLAQLAEKSYKAKDFRNASRFAREYLLTQTSYQETDPILEIYFKTESNLSRLDEILEQVYFHSSRSKPNHLVYILLDKCYNAKEIQIGEKWGERFLEEGGDTSNYAKGVLAYSGILYLKEDKKKSKQILKNPALADSKGILKKRLHLLKLALKREEKIILTATHFLAKNKTHPYADFVIALIIETYKKMGEEQKAKEWSRKLEKNFPNSAFVSQI